MNFAKWADPSYSPYTYTYDDHGNIKWGEPWIWSDEMGKYNAAYIMEMQPQAQKMTRIMGNTFIQLTPVKGLTIRAQQSADAFDWRNNYKYYPGDLNGNSGTVRESFQRFYSCTK